MHEDVIKKLKELKNIQPRSEWQAQNRDLLLSRIGASHQVTAPEFSWLDYSWVLGVLFKQKMLEPAVVMLLVLGFTVGSSLVINASFYSLPGQGLYPVKIALEKAQLAITSGDEKQIELKIEFAQKRINEIDKIVAQSDVDSTDKQGQLAAAVKELQKNVASVQQHITKENQSPDPDREKTLRIAISISSETKELSQSLDKASKTLPTTTPEVKDIVNQTVESVQAITASADKLIQADATSTDSLVENKEEEKSDAASNQLPTATSSTPIIKN